MVSRQEVEWAYRMILGREPESERVYKDHCGCDDLVALREALISSDEGSRKLRYKLQGAKEGLSFDYFRPLYAYIHIEKTGGTSVYEYLASGFKDRRISLLHGSDIHNYSLAELNQYDFVSGHMTFGEAMAFPRSQKLLMATFRDPVARLISYYRYHKAHPASARDQFMIAQAQDLTPEAFFSHPQVRSSVQIDNKYLQVFADLPPGADDETKALYLPTALERLGSLAAIGITERLSAALPLFASKAGIETREDPAPLNVTNDLPSQSSGFRSVAHVAVGPGLRRIVAPLIRFDTMIYERAAQLSAEMISAMDIKRPWFRPFKQNGSGRVLKAAFGPTDFRKTAR